MSTPNAEQIAARYDTGRLVTIPNALCMVRMAGSLVMVWLAQENLTWWFLGAFAAMMLTDWIDGKIAVIFQQRSQLGARLDSIADVVMYTCLGAGIAWLKPEFVISAAAVIMMMAASYLLSMLTALLRFSRLPAYHTLAAKSCWLLVAIGATTLLLDGPHWPAWIAIIAVTTANLEEAAISLVLPRWQSDVPSIFHAVRARQQETQSGP